MDMYVYIYIYGIPLPRERESQEPSEKKKNADKRRKALKNAEDIGIYRNMCKFQYIYRYI